MTYIFDELVEAILSISLTIAALSLLVVANPLFSQSNNALPDGKTVYSEMHQTIDEVTWTGSQVQYTLRDIEELRIPISVGGFLFLSGNDVKENIKSINPNLNYSLQTTVNTKGEVSEMQFSINY